MYADDLFNIFYRMEQPAMVREGFAYGGQGRRDFQEQYGVLETVEKIEDSDNACSRATKKTVLCDLLLSDNGRDGAHNDPRCLPALPSQAT